MTTPGMTRALSLLLVLTVSVFSAPAAARAQSRETSTVDSSTIVLRECVALPEDGIPPALLGGTQAIVIVPGVLKVSFLGGVRFGRGVLLVKGLDGHWSNPVFVTLTGGSAGFQAGVQATDLILVFKNRGSLESFLQGRGKFTLGADAAVAAGPVGRQAEAGTDIRFSSEIYSYSRSRGLFAGVSLEGAVLALDWRSNVDYYQTVVSPAEVLAGAKVSVPRSAAWLKGWMDYYTRSVRP